MKEFIFVFLVIVSASEQSEVIRKTNYGDVLGLVTTIDGSPVEQYLGIPYANPPSGKYRWKPPKAHGGWEGITLEVTRFGKACPQAHSEWEMDEDCLFLNIFVPQNANEKLPVMIFLHPGDFSKGSSNKYDGSQLAITGNVIVVTINYRIGAFGFMSTGDEQAPGNYGLLDQQMAISWVKTNIENFGGNSNSITLFGESSGAASAIYQAYGGISVGQSVSTKLNFQKIISQSAVPNSNDYYEGLPAQYALKLGNILNCPDFSTSLMVQCLRQLDWGSIVSAQEEIAQIFGKKIWLPTTDGRFLSDNPWALLGNDDVHAALNNRLDYMLGLNEYDFLVDPLVINDVTNGESFINFVHDDVENFNDPAKVSDAAFMQYVNWEADSSNDLNFWRNAASNASRDLNFLAPMMNFSSVASRTGGFNSNVYFYIFQQIPSQELIDANWAKQRTEDLAWIRGPMHTDEIGYVFGVPLQQKNAEEDDVILSKLMMKYWSNFARYGDPSFGMDEEFKWPLFNTQTRDYLAIETKQTHAEKYFENSKCVFWTDMVPLLEAGDYSIDQRQIFRNSSINDNEPLVNTTKGVVKGLRIVKDGVPVDRFFHVPFAEPPIGKLRFQHPLPNEPWEGVWDASGTSSAVQFINSCMNIGVLPGRTMAMEDCLYLNIWVPNGVHNASDLPVMVWFYGGAFLVGSATGFTFFYDMEAMVRQGNVIGVSVNYRLGSLGFLSTLDEYAIGNAGLMDQRQALIWIQENIKDFGGNPDSVTIFGESAGSVSVAMHMISPLSQDLFLRGISESGAIPADWIIQKNPLRLVYKVANRLNCSTANHKIMVNCLMDKPADQLVSIPIAWGPVVDGYFLTDLPINLLKESRHKDYLLGHNSMDGYMSAWPAFPAINTGLPMTRDDVIEASHKFATDVADHVSNAVAYKYIEWDKPYRDTLWPKLAITHMFTDSQFAAGTYWTANERVESGGTGKTYLYVYKRYTNVPFIFPDWVEAQHTGELQYVFGKPLLDVFYDHLYDENDVVLSKAMMTHWTNFAWSGDPNYPNDADIIELWPEYKSNTRFYIEFNDSKVDGSETIVGSNYRGEFMEYWRILLGEIWKTPMDQCEVPSNETATMQKIFQQKNTQRNVKSEVTCPNTTNVRKTHYGCLEGFYHDGVERYYGIPFAEAPINGLRFLKTAEANSWSDVKNCTQFSKVCPQSNGGYDPNTMNEDCLYLNVYVPSSNESTHLQDEVLNKQYAVMVWIHGGSYQRGDGMGESMVENLAKLGEVILVTVNYRLGAFGFLSTEDEAALGNYGLHDQHMAIKWVKENIQYFGGDPSLITVFGESAGAQSVVLHILSPLTTELNVKNFLMESIPIIPKDMSQLEATKQLSQHCGCGDDFSNTSAIVECLKSVDTKTIIEADISFYPNIDGEFLTKHPDQMVESTDFSRYNYLMGVNTGEGSVRWGDTQNVDTLDEFHDIIEDYFRDVYDWRTSSIEQEYRDYNNLNFGNETQTMQLALTEMFGDERYVSTTVKFANLFTTSSTVYFYQFTYAYGYDGLPIWAGAGHAAEIPYVHGGIISDTNSSELEKELSELIIQYWASFAKASNPSTAGQPQWPRYKSGLSETTSYIKLDIDTENNVTTAENLKPYQMAFWNDYMVQQEQYCVQNITVSEEPEISLVYVEDEAIILENGSTKGSVVSTELYEAVQFLGIPYALPPINELRFAKTKHLTDGDVTFSETVSQPPCIQYNKQSGTVIGKEDCLYLDLFMPTEIEAGSETLEVLVWIHGDFNGVSTDIGGSFWSGGGSPENSETSNAFDPSYLAAFANIIVVRPNYRLGALGFLTTETEELSGNYGLYDLEMVMTWVQENIKLFGGNPNKVNVWGQGSGAVAAEILASNPANKVQRAIISSGSMTSPWAVCEKNKNCHQVARNVWENVGCSEEGTVECLRQQSAVDIVSAVVPDKLTDNLDSYNLWGTWRVNPNDDIFQKAKSRNFDVLTGTSSHEFYTYLNTVYDFNATESDFLRLAINETQRFVAGTEAWSDDTSSILNYAYTDWTSSSTSSIQASAIDYYTDYLFTVDSLDTVRLNAKESSLVYQYSLVRQMETSTRHDWVGGCHGDDLIYAFGLPILSPEKYSDSDRSFSKAIMSHWSMFIRTGIPDNAYSFDWPSYTEDKTIYVNLEEERRGLDRQHYDRNFKTDKYTLWNDVLDTEIQAEVTATTTEVVHSSTTSSTSSTTVKTTEFMCSPVTYTPIASGLGMDLTPEEATTVIYALFSVSLILSVVVLMGIVYFIWWKNSASKVKNNISPLTIANSSSAL